MQFAMEERTFTIIKPNAVAMGVTGRIIDAFLQDGFRILAMRLVCMSRNDAEKFYAIHRGREFFSRLVDFMTSGPCVVMLLEREDAVAELRRLVGNTDPARAAEGTLRRMFGWILGLLVALLMWYLFSRLNDRYHWEVPRTKREAARSSAGVR